MKASPESYKWGFLYYNPDDKRLIVPKSIKWMGWTLNFANPAAYLIILVIILFVAYIMVR